MKSGRKDRKRTRRAEGVDDPEVSAVGVGSGAGADPLADFLHDFQKDPNKPLSQQI